MADQWFVVRTKQAKEVLAAVTVAAAGFPTFLPVRLVQVSHAGKRETKERPLFPRYIFARFDRELPGSDFGKINTRRGVASRGLMCDGFNRPISVPDKVIDDIRFRETIEKAKANEASTGYQPGDLFKLACGPYADIEATYIGEDSGKVWIKLTLFGRDNVVPIPFEQVPLCGKLIDKISA